MEPNSGTREHYAHCSRAELGTGRARPTGWRGTEDSVSVANNLALPACGSEQVEPVLTFSWKRRPQRCRSSFCATLGNNNGEFAQTMTYMDILDEPPRVALSPLQDSAQGSVIGSTAFRGRD